MRSKWHLLLITILITGIFVISCTPQEKFIILSFFFDGVPEPEIQELTSIQDSIKESASINQIAVSSKKESTIIFHEPYKNKNCTNCHAENSMGDIKETQPGLCYNCHNNFDQIYSNLHGPIQNGYCTVCHHPHKAKNKNLLVSKGQNICFTCHDITAVNENNIHVNIEDLNCINCHNPHGGENKYNLKKNSCFKCHNNFKNKFEYIHGPVASNHCNTCHKSHAESNNSFLLRNGQNLCTHCHTDILVTNEIHKEIKNTSCLECHNPHGGDDNLLLK